MLGSKGLVKNSVTHTFGWDAVNGIRDLNDLVTPPDGFILDRALGINERGWIVGDGHFGPNWSSSQAFVLIPAGATLAVADPVRDGDLRLRPNPCRGSATIDYRLTAPGRARVTVFDLNGRKIADLDQSIRAAGVHSARWDGRDAAGRQVPTGAYVVRLEVPGKVTTRTLAEERLPPDRGIR